MMWFGFVLSLSTGIENAEKFAMQKRWPLMVCWTQWINNTLIHAHTQKKNILAKHNKTFTYTLIKKGSGRATVALGCLAIIDLQSLHSNSWITVLKSCNVSYEPCRTRERESMRDWQTMESLYLALNTDISEWKLVVYESIENIWKYWTMPHIHDGHYLSWNK